MHAGGKTRSAELTERFSHSPPPLAGLSSKAAFLNGRPKREGGLNARFSNPTKGTSQSAAKGAIYSQHSRTLFIRSGATARALSEIEQLPDLGASPLRLFFSPGALLASTLFPRAGEKQGRRLLGGFRGRQPAKASPRMRRRRRAPFAHCRRGGLCRHLQNGGRAGAREERKGEERRLHCGKAWNLETRKRRAEELAMPLPASSLLHMLCMRPSRVLFYTAPFSII